jgi:hypothetical protein
MLKRIRIALSAGTAVAVVLVGILLTTTHFRGALAYTASGGFAISDFATGFPAANDGNGRLIGPTGLAFDPSGNLFVIDFATGTLYKFGPAGGVASAALLPNVIPGAAAGLAFDKQGHLYVARQAGDVVEVDPASGAILRTVATGIPCASGIATDPMSGDLFVSSGGCSPNIWRLANFASGPATVSTYAAPGTIWELVFVGDGTLFAQLNDSVVKYAGSGASTPAAMALVVTVPPLGGFALASNPSAPGQPPYLLANRLDGVVTNADLTASPPATRDVITGGTRGSSATVGPDGCMYTAESTTVARVTNADGSCALAPTAPWDTTAPHTTISLSGTPSAAGWYNQSVNVTLAASDPDGAWDVASTAYSVDGGAAQTYTAPFALSSDGSHQLAFWSTDKAGNAEAKNTATIKIDQVAPTTSATLAPPANGAGWITSAATVTLTASDQGNGSGVAATYYALDGAACAPGALAGCASYAGPISIATDGAHILTFFSQDNAGNFDTAQHLSLQIDATPPTITGAASPAANANGWNNSDVTVSFTCADAPPGSGVATCSGPTTLSGEGAGQSASGTATDTAGNTASATVGGINIDKTAPTVSYSGNAGTYGIAQTMNITCASSDALSGVASDTCENLSGPAYAYAPGTNTFAATATDKAGNVGSGATSFVVTVTYRDLCTLTQQFVTDATVSQTLCMKLYIANLLAALGVPQAADALLNSYINQVNAQSGASVTAAQAAILVKWAGALMA